MSTTTITKSQTDTFTEARARYVLGKIFDDFNAIIYRKFNHITTDDLKEWRGVIQYIMERNALYKFELQFTKGNQEWAVGYEVDKQGNIARDDDSGGIDFYSIPADASLSILVRRDRSNEEITKYLEKLGWGTGGTFLTEESDTHKSFSKDGFGVNIKVKGDI